jgi:hypothetical protein
MKLSQVVFISLGVVLSIGVNAQFSSPDANDLTSTADFTLSADTLAVVNNRRAAVHFNRPLLHSWRHMRNTQVATASREFYLTVMPEQLAKGVFLPVRSDRAVVRIIAQGDAAAVDSQSVDVMTESVWRTDGQGLIQVVPEAELSAAGLTSEGSQAAFIIGGNLAQGATVRYTAAAASQGQYKLHVLEPNSVRLLRFSTERNRLMLGSEGVFTAWLDQPINRAHVSLVAPDGIELRKITPQIAGNRLDIGVATEDLVSRHPGLWELRLDVRGGQGASELRRFAKLAFAVAPGTAQIAHGATSSGNRASVSFTIPVTVAVAGRYQVEGVLYGTSSQGELVPAVHMNAATWLDGNGEITLKAKRQLLAQAGVQAPFTLRHLSLKDQTRLAELHYQDRTELSIQTR